MKKRYIILGLILVLGLVLKGVFVKKDNDMFSSMIDATEVDMISVEQSDVTQALLEQFKPNVYIHKESYKPLDFYNSYLRDTFLKKSGYFDKTVNKDVTKELLDTYHRQPLYYLDYQVKYIESLKAVPEMVPIYGRVYKSKLKDQELTFLKYNLVFPYSGLPENVAWYKKLGSHLLGQPKAWHELDIHGAIHVVLHEEAVVAVVLAQHNHHKTYLVDEVPNITFSKYSNEPYLTLDGNHRLERTVGNPLDMDFLLGVTDKVPLTGGYDDIPSVEDSFLLESYVELLPLDDPLYTSTMSLGDRAKILGIFNTFYMEGPPGIDYYTLPQLLDLSHLMAFWYIDIEPEYLSIYSNLELSFTNFDISELLDYQIEKIYDKLFKN